MKKTYSTAQVAKMIGVHKRTLLGWVYSGFISEPKHHSNGGQDVRIWADLDVERARKYKQENYRKGRGRKANPKR